MQNYVVLIIVFLSYCKHSYSQISFNTFDISISYANLEQDQRLFEFPKTSSLFEESSSHSKDFEFSVMLRSQLIDHPKYRILLGFGYNQNIHRFLRPYNFQFLSGTNLLIFKSTKRYEKHQLQVSLGFEHNILTFNDFYLYANLNIIPSFNIYKEANLHNRTTNEISGKDDYWGFNFDGFEINPGLGLSFKRFYLQANYRVLNKRTIDPVIFYGSLFNRLPAPFLEQNFDNYNPEKLQLTLGFQISNR